MIFGLMIGYGFVFLLVLSINILDWTFESGHSNAQKAAQRVILSIVWPYLLFRMLRNIFKEAYPSKTKSDDKVRWKKWAGRK